MKVALNLSMAAIGLLGSVLAASHASAQKLTSSGELREQMLATAQAEIGVTERRGPDSNPRIVEYFLAVDGEDRPDSQSWCSAFIFWTALQANAKTEGASLAARSWLHVGEPTTSPHPGDIVIFWRNREAGWEGHVGLWIDESDTRVLILGGNQGQAGSVGYVWMLKTQVLGYRRLVSNSVSAELLTARGE